MFAGGLSVASVIQGGIAALHRESRQPEQILTTEESVKPFSYEVVRTWPPVHGFAWWSPNRTYRTYMNVGMAVRDPRVWGKDHLEFKLRSMEEYKRYAGMAW